MDEMSQPIPLATITNTFAKIVKKNGTAERDNISHSHATMLVENDVQTKKFKFDLAIHRRRSRLIARYTHSTEKMQEGIAALMQHNR